MFRVLFSASLTLAASAALASDYQPVEEKVIALEKRLDARIGVSIYEVSTKKGWSYKGNQRFPLMSTFKTLACAKLMNDADNNKLSLNSATTVTKEMLVTYSPVTAKQVGKNISLEKACEATMLTSDNTAANIVLEHIGGPSELTNFLRSTGDSVSRLDRIETKLNEGKPGDLRDTTTPEAIVQTLNQLVFGNVLSEPSKNQLKQWMIENQVADGLLRSVLPDGWSIADRTGAGGYGSRGIAAIVWPEYKPPFIVSIYITETDSSFDARNSAIAEIGELIFKSGHSNHPQTSE
ncbi:MAG: class A beta-lactamase [Endozoicomonas sp.]|uniref:class A beta-lactamase n=1 Tax=Endozoicomonas sp. TaxID=1892382 RepID=UPI003D9B8B62